MARDITSSRALYSRLLSYVRPYWKVFLAAMLCMGLSSLAEPVFPAMMKYMLDDGFAKSQGGWAWLIYPLVILAVFLVRAIFGFLGEYALSWVANNVVTELRQAMFARIVHLPMRYYSDNLSGHLMSRVMYDVTNVTAAATTAITSLISSLSIIALMGWLFYLNWQLTLITLVMAPPIAVAVRFFSRRLRKVSRDLQLAMGKITQVLQETIEGYKVVRIFGGQAYERERFRQAVREQRGLALRTTLASAGQSPIVYFFATVALAIIIGVALRQAAEDQTTVGSFVSFITAMLMVLPALRRLTDVNAPIQRGLAAAESIFALIDEAAEEDTGTVELGHAQGHIDFDHVTFTYPGAERPALNDLSLSVWPGECVALVGASGSGKTTVANLLPRFYGVETGEIRVDGHRLSEICLESLRANIALVSQDVVLFNDTIAANIAYGSKRGASREDIRAAAGAAHALEFIDVLAEGIDTVIGENGVKLSGGQRQRLAIARAILKDAPILILDEATSALDTESERHVQAALDELMRGRTTLVIAHRLSTIENADRIVVLHEGRLCESGRHAELLALNGAYARLHSLQVQAEESAAS
jgi:subfamily B ATP-binding cassette protein MsbA